MRYLVLSYRDSIVEEAAWQLPLGGLDELAEDIGSSKLRRADDHRLCTSGTGVSVNNILERVDLGDGLVAFRTLPTASGGQRWMRAEHETWGPPGVEKLGVPGEAAGALILDTRDDPGREGTFREIEFAGHWSLQTWKGLFVTAEGDGEGNPLTINRDEIGEWQRFSYIVPPGELLPVDEPEPTLTEQVTSSATNAATQTEAVRASAVSGARGAVEDRQTQASRGSATGCSSRSMGSWQHSCAQLWLCLVDGR